jgi:hypothetical protein
MPDDEIAVSGEPTAVAPEAPFLPRHPIIEGRS